VFSVSRRLNSSGLLLCYQVNIIPIIAKSDAISKSELTKFKIKITSELVSNGVQIYQFPTDDETVAEINSTMNVSLFLCHVHVFLC
jgi:septin family protein